MRKIIINIKILKTEIKILKDKIFNFIDFLRMKKWLKNLDNKMTF